MPKYTFRSPYITFEEYTVYADSEQQAQEMVELDSVLYYSDEQENDDTYSIEDYFKELGIECPNYNRFELVKNEEK